MENQLIVHDLRDGPRKTVGWSKEPAWQGARQNIKHVLLRKLQSHVYYGQWRRWVVQLERQCFLTQNQGTLKESAHTSFLQRLCLLWSR